MVARGAERRPCGRTPWSRPCSATHICHEVRGPGARSRRGRRAGGRDGAGGGRGRRRRRRRSASSCSWSRTAACSSTSSRRARTTRATTRIEACETSQFENHLRGRARPAAGRRRACARPPRRWSTCSAPAPGRSRADVAGGARRGRRARAPLRQGRGAPGPQDGPRHRARRRPSTDALERARGAPPRRWRAVSGAEPVVGIVMGSDSDLPMMGGAADVLREARGGARGARRVGPPHARRHDRVRARGGRPRPAR